MICENCGAPLPRGARECDICGFPVSTAPKKRLPVGALIGSVSVILVLLAVIITVATRNAGRPDYASLFDRYFTALEKRDAEAYAHTRPDAYIAYLTREDGGAYLNYTVYVNELSQTIDERMNGYAAVCGSNIRISYRIDRALDIEPYVERISDILQRWYAFPENSVQQALLVNGSYEVKGNTASQSYEIAETLLIRIGDTWYFSPDIGQTWKGSAQ